MTVTAEQVGDGLRDGTGTEATVVTGLAVMAANGHRTEEFWAATRSGRSGLAPITRFDAGAFAVAGAGQVPDPDTAAQVPAKLAVQTDLWTQFALVLGGRALADARLDPAGRPDHSMAVVTASSSGGNHFGQVEIERLWRRGPQHVGPYQSIAWFYAATTGQLSIRQGMKGPCGVMVAEQAGGLDAIAHSRRLIRRENGIVLTGGTEAPISPYALACQVAAGGLAAEGAPEESYRPYAPDAAGHLPGEGGAVLILESETSAASRGARVYGTVAGYASGYASTARHAAVLRRIIGSALDDAGLTPEAVDVVFPDAAAIRDLDQAEISVLEGIFGPKGVPVSVPKTLFGRVYAGGAPLDVACALLAMRDGVLPPGRLTGVRADLPLDLVVRERPARVRNALVIARGARGFVSALVLSAPGPQPAAK